MRSRAGTSSLLAEVDHFAVEAVADGAELVFHQERARVGAVVDVAGVEVPELAGGSLDQGGDRDGLVRAHGDVADAHLDGVEVGCGRMSHQIFFALSMQLVLMRRLT